MTIADEGGSRNVQIWLTAPYDFPLRNLGVFWLTYPDFFYAGVEKLRLSITRKLVGIKKENVGSWSRGVEMPNKKLQRKFISGR